MKVKRKMAILVGGVEKTGGIFPLPVKGVEKSRWVFSPYPLKALRKAVGNMASSLKFELISHKIGLVFLRDGT